MAYFLLLAVGCEEAEAIAAYVAAATETRTCFGFEEVDLFRSRLFGGVLGLCRSDLPPTCSYLPEAAAKALAAMLEGSLGNMQRLVWKDVLDLRLALDTLGSTASGQLYMWC